MAETQSTQLSEAQGYLAMFLFLNSYWEEGKRQSEDIAGLLSEMNPFGWREGSDRENLQSSDPAIWPQWKDAVERVLRGEPDPKRYRLTR